MKHPSKWRETINPFDLPFHNFELIEILGYPHAGNDVFFVHGKVQQNEIEAYIKVARQSGADIENEIRVIKQLNSQLAPKIIDYDSDKYIFLVTQAKQGERLSTLVTEDKKASFNYLYEYGQTLAKLHNLKGAFAEVKDRKFFHIPDKYYFIELDLLYVYDYLINNQPQSINHCFCHGDFHYANLLWQNKHISAILDFELSGLGNKEFDIAWALILRPSQKFLNTKEEMDWFMQGYRSCGSYNLEYVKYYMVLIYSYFYKIGKMDKEYQKYIQTVFQNYCL